MKNSVLSKGGMNDDEKLSFEGDVESEARTVLLGGIYLLLDGIRSSVEDLFQLVQFATPPGFWWDRGAARVGSVDEFKSRLVSTY